MTERMNKEGTVIGVSGPVVTVRTEVPASMFEVARVGEEGLLGEVIRVDEFSVRIQVYEDTNGLASGAPVFFETTSFPWILAPDCWAVFLTVSAGLSAYLERRAFSSRRVPGLSPLPEAEPFPSPPL